MPQLRYPKDTLYDQSTDYMSFEFYKYIPPFSKDLDSNQNPIDSVGYYNTSGNQKAEQASGLSQIYLYMPEDVSSSFAADWGDKSFTNVQRDALRAAGAAAALRPGATGSAAIDAARNAAGRVNSLIAQAVTSGVNNIPAGIGGANNINQTLGTTVGAVLNPNVELLFNSFGLRKFNHTWKFAPQSDGEALEIKKIYNTFKKASLPNYGGAGNEAFERLRNKLLNPLGRDASQEEKDRNEAASTLRESNINNNYIRVPNLVQVKYKKGAGLHPWLPKWKLAVITGVEINFTPDGTFATYEDGSPVATAMTVSFQETKLVYGNEINIDSEEAQF